MFRGESISFSISGGVQFSFSRIRGGITTVVRAKSASNLFSSNDFEAYELATCINALCFNKRKKTFIYDKDKTLQLIKGYETIRKLQKKKKDCLNILCKGSALRYLATRSYDYINTPKSAIIKKKDPREYIQKLAFHKKINSFSSYIK